VLAGEDQRDRHALPRQGIGHRREFDCFRTGTDNQNYATRQPSP
jgi:hypothetical protein